MEWQPIETAPKDGTVIIVRGTYDGKKEQMLACAAKFNGSMWWRDNNGYGFTASCHPTHWMPLPPN